jgi:hypothetical protein
VASSARVGVGESKAKTRERHNLLETEKANDSRLTESQEVEVAIWKIPFAILTRET